MEERSRLKGLIANLRKEHKELRELLESQIKAEKEQARADKLRKAEELKERKLVKKADKAEQTRLKKNEYNRQYYIDGGEELKAKKAAQKREARKTEKH